MHGLGRRHAPDVRDHRHLMAMGLPVVVPPRPKAKTWLLRWKGDQGQTDECVAFAWYALLRSRPVLQDKPLPLAIYDRAQQLDEFPDTPPEGGTSVRAGAKALKEAGKLTAYAWAFDLETVLNWLAFHGPVVWGVNWYSSMFDANPTTGLLSIGGIVEGGHAVCCIGYDEQKHWLIFQNSWGRGWGVNGRFTLRYADATRLLFEDGEVCTASEPV